MKKKKILKRQNEYSASSKVKTLILPSEKVIEDLKNASTKEWIPPIIDILLETGMRIGEIFGCRLRIVNKETKKFEKIGDRPGLCVGDVAVFNKDSFKSDRNDRPIWIIKDNIEVLGKRNKTRSIPLTSKAKESIEKLIEIFELREENDKLIPFEYRIVEKEIRKAKIAINYEGKLVPHTFRHVIGTKLVKNNRIKEAQQLLGHTNVATTIGIYTHATMDDIKKALEEK